jgi:hypothetical protein
LLPNKSQVRGVLGGSLTNGVIIHIYVAHPLLTLPTCAAIVNRRWNRRVNNPPQDDILPH